MALSFNINAAVKHIISHALPSSIHLCARYVANAMDAGGLKYTRKASAYMYASELPRVGFLCLATKTGKAALNEWSNANAKAGDIAVMAHGLHGHICMYTGTLWISDFKLKSAWVYGTEGTVLFFRFTGKVTSDPQELAAILNLLYSGGGTSSDGGDTFTGEIVSDGILGNLFANAGDNAYSLPTIRNSKETAENTDYTRIYSSNNATIVLDELSIPVDPTDLSNKKPVANTTTA